MLADANLRFALPCREMRSGMEIDMEKSIENRNENGGRSSKQQKNAAGRLAVILLVTVECVFLGLLIYTHLLPASYVALVGVMFLLVAILVTALLWASRNKAKQIVGYVLTFLMLLLLIPGGNYIYRTTRMLFNISNVQTEVTLLGVYVRAEDGAVTLQDTAEYAYGILEELDRESTDEALQELEEELETTLRVQEFHGILEIVDGLLRGQVDAILLNQTYLDIAGDMEGYEELSTLVREIGVRDVEKVVENATPGAQENVNSEEEETEKDVFVIYFSGIDSRSSKLVAKSRSDANLLAVVNANTHKVLLISTPRDYYVSLSIAGGAEDKLTHASIYGIECSVETMEMLYDIDIDYYGRMNFYGFIDIIDALGGITVWSDYEFDSMNHPGHHFTVGANEVDGDGALAFARERFSYAEGDIQRGRNQLEIIRAVIDKAASPAILSNYTSLLDSVEGSFETNVPYYEIAYLVRKQLTSGAEWEVTTYNVSGTGASRKPYSLSQNAYVMIPDQASVDQAKEMIAKILAGE